MRTRSGVAPDRVLRHLEDWAKRARAVGQLGPADRLQVRRVLGAVRDPSLLTEDLLLAAGIKPALIPALALEVMRLNPLHRDFYSRELAGARSFADAFARLQALAATLQAPSPGNPSSGPPLSAHLEALYKRFVLGAAPGTAAARGDATTGHHLLTAGEPLSHVTAVFERAPADRAAAVRVGLDLYVDVTGQRWCLGRLTRGSTRFGALGNGRGAWRFAPDRDRDFQRTPTYMRVSEAFDARPEELSLCTIDMLAHAVAKVLAALPPGSAARPVLTDLAAELAAARRHRGDRDAERRRQRQAACAEIRRIVAEPLAAAVLRAGRDEVNELARRIARFTRKLEPLLAGGTS